MGYSLSHKQKCSQQDAAYISPGSSRVEKKKRKSIFYWVVAYDSEVAFWLMLLGHLPISVTDVREGLVPWLAEFGPCVLLQYGWSQNQRGDGGC